WLTRLNADIDLLDLDTHGFLVCDVTADEFTATFVMADGWRDTVTVRRGG
ncbi:MAG: hypothetical protein HKN41_06310, partial [Ilumatobacter sp.]|nr:hypothetical protein [Ilumatobacter sp.]